MSFVEAIRTGISEISALMNPYKANEFFKNVEVKPSEHVSRYLIILGLFLFAGYAMNLYYKAGFEAESRCSLNSAIESALVTYLTLVALPFISGSIISLFGKSLIGKELETNEAFLVIAYPLCIILISGIFRAHILTIILHYFSIGYGLYLMYTAVSARFGFDRAILIFMFFLIVNSLVLMFLFWVGVTSINTITDIITWFGIPLAESPLRRIPPWCY